MLAAEQVPIKYDSCRRMIYHPEFHPNHRKPISEEDLEYLCYFYERDHRQSIAFALGRTEATVSDLYCKLKKKGLVEYYKNRYLTRFE